MESAPIRIDAHQHFWDLSRSEFDNDWERDLRTAAQYSNIDCNFSGFTTEADWDNWTAADLQPYIEIALAAFGPRRCMFGSDWPVCKLAGSYTVVLAACKDVISSLSIDAQD